MARLADRRVSHFPSCTFIVVNCTWKHGGSTFDVLEIKSNVVSGPEDKITKDVSACFGSL